MNGAGPPTSAAYFTPSTVCSEPWSSEDGIGEVGRVQREDHPSALRVKQQGQLVDSVCLCRALSETSINETSLET